MVEVLQKLERKRAGLAVEPTAEDIRKFLEVEASLDQPITVKS